MQTEHDNPTVGESLEVWNLNGLGAMNIARSCFKLAGVVHYGQQS